MYLLQHHNSQQHKNWFLFFFAETEKLNKLRKSGENWAILLPNWNLRSDIYSQIGPIIWNITMIIMTRFALSRRPPSFVRIFPLKSTNLVDRRNNLVCPPTLCQCISSSIFASTISTLQNIYPNCTSCACFSTYYERWKAKNIVDCGWCYLYKEFFFSCIKVLIKVGPRCHVGAHLY